MHFLTPVSLDNNLASQACKVRVLKEKGRSPEGFSLQKNSEYTKEFNHVLAKIQGGELDLHLH